MDYSILVGHWHLFLQDEELLSVPGNYSLNSATRAAEETTSRLTLQENGYWKAKGRVPLVGAGRIVDNLSGPLVSVGSTGTEAQILVDTDLTNIFTLGSIVGAEASQTNWFLFAI